MPTRTSMSTEMSTDTSRVAAQRTQRIPLRDLVLALIAHASRAGHKRIPISHFFVVFGSLAEDPEFRAVAPPLGFTRSPHAVYCKRLDDALQSLIGYCIELPNPSLQNLEMSQDVAERQLRWLANKYDLGLLQPLAQKFVAGLQSR